MEQAEGLRSKPTVEISKGKIPLAEKQLSRWYLNLERLEMMLFPSLMKKRRIFSHDYMLSKRQHMNEILER